MAWIKMETHTPDKPEIFQIADELGIDANSAFGRCFRVWVWFDAHTTNGKANGAGVSSALPREEKIREEYTNTKTLSGKPDVDPPKLNGSASTAKEILSFLNAKTGRNYRPVAANLEPIVARIKEGFTPQDIKTVIARKCREWMADDKMAGYLRPATLFNRTKFAQYNGECVEE